jgi:hypothetical protein
VENAVANSKIAGECAIGDDAGRKTERSCRPFVLSNLAVSKVS